MNTNELMDGDIVLLKGKPVQVVSTSGITYSSGQQEGNGIRKKTMFGVAPMRLSERLLKALGFAPSVSPDEWVYEDAGKSIDICVSYTPPAHWWVVARHGRSTQTDNYQYFEGFADHLHLFQQILRCCRIDIGIDYEKVKDL